MSACAAPAGSPCRTGKGKVAVQYHTARFRVVPHLAKTLNVPTPAARKPGSVWVELLSPAAAGAESAGQVRIGYVRASTVRQSLDTQLDSSAFEAFGKRGRGEWVSVMANPGHAYMVVAGLRFDTSSGKSSGNRWTTRMRSRG